MFTRPLLQASRMLVLALLFPLSLLAGCSSGGGAPSLAGSSEPPELTALRTCGIVDDGRFGVYTPTFEDDCFVRCVVAHSTCDELATFSCDGTTRFEVACDDVCHQDVACADGYTIPMSDLCNGRDDCDFGEDENDCGAYRFRCEDGTTIDKASECDGYDDCGFGEDEAGCPTFRCGDGSIVLGRDVCDFEQDCPGGEDEVGCATLSCPG